MRLLSLEVQNYRNICAARLEPGRELTVICGNNGQGWKPIPSGIGRKAVSPPNLPTSA